MPASFLRPDFERWSEARAIWLRHCSSRAGLQLLFLVSYLSSCSILKVVNDNITDVWALVSYPSFHACRAKFELLITPSFFWRLSSESWGCIFAVLLQHCPLLSSLLRASSGKLPLSPWFFRCRVKFGHCSIFLWSFVVLVGFFRFKRPSDEYYSTEKFIWRCWADPGILFSQDLRAVLVGVLILLSFFQFLNEKIRHAQVNGLPYPLVYLVSSFHLLRCIYLPRTLYWSLNIWRNISHK